MKRLMVAIVLIAAVGTGFWVVRSRTATPPASESMRTARVVRGTLISSVSATGALQPYAEVEVRSRATGTVVDLRVQEGNQVKQGQLLAVIDDSDARAAYQNALAQLAASNARLSQARQQLAATGAQNITRVTQAEDARRTAKARLTQVQAGSRPEEIEQARQALQQAQLAVDLAKQNLDRTRDLLNQGLVARQQLDQAQNQYDTAQAQARAAEAKLRDLQAGSTRQEIAVAQSQVREAESALAVAQAARLQEAALAAAVAAAQADVQNSQANVAQAQKRMGESEIKAPIDGMVAKLSVQVGQSVIGGASSGGTLVMTIADTRIIQADIQVDESDIAQVGVGMPVRITADALPGKTFAGKVIRIAPQATVTQNVTQFDAIVQVENPDRLLRLGMSADAEFVIIERQNVLLVPVEAVRGKDAKIVLVVEGESQKLVPAEVETGATDGRQVEITKGLEVGQTVYLGTGRSPARTTPAGTTPAETTRPQQPVSPFQPRFQRRPSGPESGPH